MNGQKIINELQNKVNKASVCPAHCLGDCCRRLAPVLMTYTEWLRLDNSTKFLITGRNLSGCPFLAENHCKIYHDRPMPCRWYGLSDGGQTYCQHIDMQGRIPEQEIEDVRRRWTLLLWKQIGFIMAGKRRNQERIAWLGYCVSIPAGRRIAEQLKTRLT